MSYQLRHRAVLLSGVMHVLFGTRSASAAYDILVTPSKQEYTMTPAKQVNRLSGTRNHHEGTLRCVSVAICMNAQHWVGQSGASQSLQHGAPAANLIRSVVYGNHHPSRNARDIMIMLSRGTGMMEQRSDGAPMLSS